MIDKNLYPFFWDIDPAQLDIRRYKHYIIERLLELVMKRQFAGYS